jgi:hypothetical protein
MFLEILKWVCNHFRYAHRRALFAILPGPDEPVGDPDTLGSY